MQAYNEADVLKRLSQGDEDALADIMLWYRDKIFNVAMNLLHDRDLAREIVQETFITIWHRRKSFEHSTEIGGYCRVVARNKTVSLITKLARQKSAQYQYALDHVGGTRSDDDSIETELMHQYHNGLLESSINNLSPQQKTVFTLFASGATYAQIAEQMNITRHTVKYHLTEAREALRRNLKPHILPACIFILSQFPAN
jgi:RNA polymerase sigma-70 factor (ECF subfamily)